MKRLALAVLAGAAWLRAELPFTLIAAHRFGSDANDMAEDVCFDAEGGILVAGHAKNGLLGLDADSLGPADAESTYPHGFVVRLDPSGSKVSWQLQFPKGVCFPTTVQANSNGVYVAGYATPALEPWLRGHGGLITEADRSAKDLKLFTPLEHKDEPKFDRALDQRGTPFVLRLDATNGRILGGTFLEGWQSVWHVPKPLGEDRWQPVGLAFLGDGSLVVSHDGGYNLAPPPGAPAGMEEFYRVPDHLSRLGADLRQRLWHRRVHSPPVDPERVNQMIATWPYGRGSDHALRAPWTEPFFGNTRILRLRSDGKNRLYAAGWSPTRTAAEPWWSPFLLAMDGQGEILWAAYQADPMSGSDRRMNHLVSDAAVRSVAVDAQGQVLAALIGDGGNSILRQDPLDYRLPANALRGSVFGFRGRTLFWGALVRLEAATGALLGGNHLGGLTGRNHYSPAWATDLAGLANGSVLAVGRNREGFEVDGDAWHKGPGGFLRLYHPDFGLKAGTSLAGIAPWAMALRGNRLAVVGTASPEAVQAGPGLGLRDGVLLVVELGKTPPILP